MDKWDLPVGSEWLRIQKLTRKTERRNPGKTPQSKFYYVEISSVDNEKGIIKLDQVRLIQGSNVPSRARKVIKAGDVLVATTRPYLRNIASVPTQLDGEICSTGFCVLRAKKGKIIPQYLYYACRTSFFINQLLPKQRGTSYPAVSDSDIFETQIPLPYPDNSARSLAMQRYIVAQIERHFAELRKMRALNREVKEDTERVMAEVLAEIFREGLKKGWPQKSVKELIIGKPQYGISVKPTIEPVGIPILRMGNISNGQVVFDNLKYVGLSQKQEEKYVLHEGDILFNRTNSAELVGKSAVYMGGPRSVFASYLIRVVANPKKALPQFIVAYINSPFGRRYIQSQLSRAIGQTNVNAKKLQAMPIPTPSILEQQYIVASLEAIESDLKIMQEIPAQNERTLQEVEQMILAKAFRGEL